MRSVILLSPFYWRGKRDIAMLSRLYKDVQFASSRLQDSLNTVLFSSISSFIRKSVSVRVCQVLLPEPMNVKSLTNKSNLYILHRTCPLMVSWALLHGLHSRTQADKTDFLVTMVEVKETANHMLALHPKITRYSLSYLLAKASYVCIV